MRVFFFILAIICSSAFASEGPKEIELNPKLASSLGFSIQVKNEGHAIMVELIGPKESPFGCLASRSGSYLLDSNGKELFLFITEIPDLQSLPQAVGYYVNKSHTMGVFIDYLCAQKMAQQSVRYTVPSINNWLIPRP